MVYSKSISAAALALVASTLVNAQTSTKCDPTKTSCPPDAAFGNDKVSCDFTQGECDAFSNLSGTKINYGKQGAVFDIKSLGQAPTIQSDKYIFFGRVDFELQAAKGKGIVTSCVLESDDLDEVDWEWVGGDDAQVQSNYFSKGDTTTYDRGAYHPVSNPLDEVHTYSLEWTPSALSWIIDGKTVRTLTYEAAKGGSTYPQTPMRIKLGTWVAGSPDAAPGTVSWAGGLTDFSQAPFNAYYKSITITDYAGGDSPASKDVKQYVYGDHSGSWESIKVELGNGSSSKPSGSSGNDSSSQSSSPSHATKTTVESASTSASATGTLTTSTTSSSAEPTTTSDSTTGSGASSTPTAVPASAGRSVISMAAGALALVCLGFQLL